MLNLSFSSGVVVKATYTLVGTFTYSDAQGVTLKQASCYYTLGSAPYNISNVALRFIHRESGAIVLDVANNPEFVSWDNARGVDAPVSVGVTNHLDVYCWWQGSAAGPEPLVGVVNADRVTQ